MSLTPPSSARGPTETEAPGAYTEVTAAVLSPGETEIEHYVVEATGEGAKVKPVSGAPESAIIQELSEPLVAQETPKKKKKEKKKQEPEEVEQVEKVSPQIATPREEAAAPVEQPAALIRWLEDVRATDTEIVGGKVANLGEMLRALKSEGIDIPTGFSTTSAAYRSFLDATPNLEKTLQSLLADIDMNDIDTLRKRAKKARQLIMGSPLPKSLRDEILGGYDVLSRRYAGTEGTPSQTGYSAIDCAIRSSATAEDLPTASFAGQMDSFLNISGGKAIVEAVHRCYASLFNDRAVHYRLKNGIPHEKVAISVCVQKMVRSDVGAAGVAFTLDTDSGFRGVVVINANYGLGETVVGGKVNPDEFTVFKPLLLKGFPAIISQKRGTKVEKAIYHREGTKIVAVPKEMRQTFCLTQEQILQLSRYACKIEEHFKQPMDIEFAFDGVDEKLYIVQARAETVQSRADQNILREYRLKNESAPKIVDGLAIGRSVASGRARVVSSPSRAHDFKEGDILVAENTDPDWEPLMKKAAAVITNSGGRTAHAAIIARELGIPAAIGTKRGTELIKTGQDITVSCAEGAIAYVYSGKVEFDIFETKIDEIPHCNTQVMLNIGNPSDAFALSSLPVAGVGLARVEFIISDAIRIHPMSLVKYDEMKDKREKKMIDDLTAAYDVASKTQYFVDELASGVATICAAFYPRKVIVRLSDFKTSEYAQLIGGAKFEPHERNPMLGWRGASRYYHDDYKAGFALECKAMRKVHEIMGFNNLIVMIPFVRTLEEAGLVLAEMRKNDLRVTADPKDDQNLRVYMMVELPSNVILASKFAKMFAGFSIGSNDLTQLTLGVDRDSSLLQSIFSEKNEAVLKLIEQAVVAGTQAGISVGICGEAASDPEFAQWLVQKGINSVSISADVALKTVLKVAEIEKSPRNLDMPQFTPRAYDGASTSSTQGVMEIAPSESADTEPSSSDNQASD